jgi:hypothetical protein
LRFSGAVSFPEMNAKRTIPYGPARPAAIGHCSVN